MSGRRASRLLEVWQAVLPGSAGSTDSIVKDAAVYG
jgi:hypothetical protein